MPGRTSGGDAGRRHQIRRSCAPSRRMRSCSKCRVDRTRLVMEALEALRTRRSYGRLTEPAPSDEELRAILTAAAAAPDHGELRPFRFTLVRGDGMDAFGEVLEGAYLRRCTDTGKAPVPAKAQKERTKLNRAPLVIIVSAVRQPS